MTPPTRDGRGSHLGGKRSHRAPSRDHVNRTINNRTVQNHINTRVSMGNRLRRGQHYWFYNNGMRHSHYYDHYGVHWFGFYLGDVYFWTRYHSGKLWWNDATRGRSLYYQDGFWWWANPMAPGVPYIYRDGRYLRYEPVRGGYRTTPETPSSPVEAPEDQTSFYSEDGTRLVEIFGEKKEAYLYDATGEEPELLAFLAENVEEVQFSGGTEDAALQVLVISVDEEGLKSFTLFDAEGIPYGAPTDSVDTEKQLGKSEAFKSLGAGSVNW